MQNALSLLINLLLTSYFPNSKCFRIVHASCPSRLLMGTRNHFITKHTDSCNSTMQIPFSQVYNIFLGAARQKSGRSGQALTFCSVQEPEGSSSQLTAPSPRGSSLSFLPPLRLQPRVDLPRSTCCDGFAQWRCLLQHTRLQNLFIRRLLMKWRPCPLHHTNCCHGRRQCTLANLLKESRSDP